MEIDSIDHYVIILFFQLIAHSSTHFSTIEIQHISLSLVCLTINIQIYSIYNYISLINLRLIYFIRLFLNHSNYFYIIFSFVYLYQKFCLFFLF